MEPEFSEGDIVFLKSGSPRLTVAKVCDNGYLDVTWITDGGSSVKQATFRAVMLTKTEPRRTS